MLKEPLLRDYTCIDSLQNFVFKIAANFNASLPMFDPLLKCFSKSDGWMRANNWSQAKRMSSFVENIQFLNCSFNFGNNRKSQDARSDYKADVATPLIFLTARARYSNAVFAMCGQALLWYKMKERMRPGCLSHKCQPALSRILM